MAGTSLAEVGEDPEERGYGARGQAPTMQTEVFPFTLFALGGMMTFVAANDLLTMFIALEVLSLPLYLMCGLARRRRLDSRRLEHDLLQAITTGDENHEVEFAILLH